MKRKLGLIVLLLLALVIATTSTAGAATTYKEKTFYLFKGQTTDISIPSGYIGVIYCYPNTAGNSYFEMKQDALHLVVSNQATVSFAWAKSSWNVFNAPWTTLYYKNYMKVKLYSSSRDNCYKIVIKPLGWGPVNGAHAKLI